MFVAKVRGSVSTFIRAADFVDIKVVEKDRR